MTAYIFQGNPNRYNIEEYIRTHQKIYWTCNRYKSQICVGDDAFIWRAGKNAGLIALGKVVTLPQSRKTITDLSALRDDLWIGEIQVDDSLKVGIEISEVRLSKEDGFLDRASLKDNPLLQKAQIITNPNATVFKPTDEERAELLSLWQGK